MTQEKKTRHIASFPVVGIGASAGGLEAFKKLIAAIPEDSGIAYVLVQHLEPNHESALPELLQKVTRIPVLEIADDIRVEQNHIYVIPSNKILTADDGALHLSQRPEKTNRSRNEVIDLFFKSLAEVHQANAIGVVLSGTASDGTAGLKAIKDYGGITFAQDEASAAFDSMPNSAVQAGVVDFILPPEEIPPKILDITRSINEIHRGEENLPPGEEEVFRQIISLLRVRMGTDFTYYKQTTIRRRILRRMALNKSEDLNTYVKYLRENKTEQNILYQDLLIPVTGFFRDHKSFDLLCEKVLPLILKNKAAGEPIRIWVAGCSTGEEAYSIAICLKEMLDDRPLKVQIFATDISETAIAKARSGIYAKQDVEVLSRERLQAFFTKVNGNYQVNKNIREMCVFAAHNFLKDPPFGKLNLITCRNVLIYFGPYLQKKALTTFHYSLDDNGFLMLGKSETVSSVPELFNVASKSDKLFTRKDVPGKFTPIASQRTEQNLRVNPESEPVVNNFQKIADDILLNKYTPAGVIVNDNMDIVHFRGSTGNYLEQFSGKPSHNLLKMAKNGLSFELRNILHKAKKEKVSVLKQNIHVNVNGMTRNIAIEAIPLPNSIEPHYLILFHDNSVDNKVTTIIFKDKPSAKGKKDPKDLRIAQLENEISQAREDMRSITEDQETANEELQSANEELLSSSEELQSLNEELETGKEELQSTNEELVVVNQELISLMEQLKKEKDYARSIVETIRDPLLVLDKNLRVKSANNSYYKTFRVNESETEGRLIYELGNKQWNVPELRIQLESILPEKSKFHDFEMTLNLANIGERIMLLNAQEIQEDGPEKLILLAMEDVTDQRRVEEERRAKRRFQFIADAMPQKVWTADGEGNVNYFNKIWLEYTGRSFEELKNWGWEKIIHPDDWRQNKKQWQYALDTGNDFEFEHRLLNKEGKYEWHLTRGVAFKDDKGKIKMWVGTNTEFQEQKKQKEELEKAVVERTSELKEANETLEEKNKELENLNKELQSFAYVSSHDLQEPLRKIQTFATRILEKETTNLSENGKDYFLRMRGAAKRMQLLIEDLLIFSRVSTTERKFENTELNKIVEEVKQDFREVIEESHAIIETKETCSAKVIPFQLRQLVQNLLGNALKFHKPGNPPRITITCKIENSDTLNIKKLAPGKDYCHITIKDNGIGFEPEFNEKIFEVFQRLHAKADYPGTGIGLAIVKKIVENHNGIILANGELDKGAQFDIYFPAA